jgi:hypothetical protein
MISALATFLLAASLATPSTATASSPSTATATKPDLAAAQRLSPQEETILHGVVDETSEVAGDALYLLLRHAMMLPDGAETLNEAEHPNPLKLWQEPQRYRGRLIYVVGQFVGKMLDTSSQIQPNTFWTGPAFATYINVPDWPEPMVIILPDRPPDWGRGAKIEVAGFFYKLLDQTSSRDSSKVGPYPVLVARRLYRPAVELPGFRSPIGLIVGVGVALAVVFFLLRKSTRRRRVSTLEMLRQQREQPPTGAEESPPGPNADEAELARQVEQYRKEHEGH